MPIDLTILALAGFVVAVTNTVVGPTGGAMVGVLSFIIPGRATIALHAAVSLLSSSSRVFILRKHINWNVTKTIFIWSLPALPVGAFGVMVFPDIFWSFAIGTFLVLYGSTEAIQSYVSAAKGLRLPAFISMCASFFVGTGGTLINPFIIENSTSPSQAIATQSIVVMWQHFAKIVLFTAVGFSFLDHLDAFLALSAGVLLGNVVGAYALKRFDLTSHQSVQRWGLFLVGALLLVHTFKQAFFSS